MFEVSPLQYKVCPPESTNSFIFQLFQLHCSLNILVPKLWKIVVRNPNPNYLIGLNKKNYLLMYHYQIIVTVHRCSLTPYLFTFVAKIGNNTIHSPLTGSTALINFFMVMFRHWQHLVKVRVASWSAVIQNKQAVTWYIRIFFRFNQNHDLSPTLTNMLLLPKPEHRQKSGCKPWILVSVLT